MLGRSHAVMAFTVGTVASIYLFNEINIPFLAGALFGGLLPDVDHPSSKLGRKLPFLSWLLYLVAGHRGLTHSWVPLASMGGLSIWLAQYYGEHAPLSMGVLGLVLGYATHLAGDLITNGGIPLLWPKKKRVRIPLFNTGSMGERLFMFVWNACFILWLADFFGLALFDEIGGLDRILHRVSNLIAM